MLLPLHQEQGFRMNFISRRDMEGVLELFLNK